MPTSKPLSRVPLALLIVCASLLWHAELSAETFYKWTNDDGSTTYGKHPPKDREAIPITTSGYRPSVDASDSGPEQSKAASGDSENCKIARNNLAILEEGGLIRQRDQDGNEQALSETQINEEKERARQAIREYCQTDEAQQRQAAQAKRKKDPGLCAAARANLQGLQQGGLIRQTQSNGEEVILTEEQVEQQIKEAKRVIDDNC